MSSLLISNRDLITTITLNRPSIRNAFDESLILELTKVLKQIDRDKKIRVVCLEGAGDFFCAGADLAWMKRVSNYSYKENLKDATRFSNLLETLHHLTKPTIAIVKGGAYGGALGLLACCDIVITEKSAQFSFSETRVGLIPAVISPYIFQAMGERHAKRYFLTAEKFSALQAKNMGLIHEVTDKKNLLKTKEKIISELMKNTPKALSEAKKLFSPIDQKTIQNTIKLLAKIRTSQETREGIKSFFEKRRPFWQL